MDQKVEQPPTASEAAEVNAERPKTTAPMSKGYMPSFNLLGLLVWPCISDKQEDGQNKGTAVDDTQQFLVVDFLRSFLVSKRCLFFLLKSKRKPGRFSEIMMK